MGFKGEHLRGGEGHSSMDGKSFGPDSGEVVPRRVERIVSPLKETDSPRKRFPVRTLPSSSDEVRARVDPPIEPTEVPGETLVSEDPAEPYNELVITLEPILSEGQILDTTHTTDLVITRYDELKGMGSAEKYRITGRIGSHKVSLVQRFDDQNFSENWKRYKDAGLPVVPTMRKTVSNTVVMTDLRANGFEIYGRSLIRQLKKTGDEREGTVFEPPPGVDERFLELTHPDNIGAIEAEIDRIVAVANEKGIRLPTDDPMELVVSENGWQMMILDLEEIGPEDDTTYNNSVKKDVVHWLKQARERMLRYSTKKDK